MANRKNLARALKSATGGPGGTSLINQAIASTNPEADPIEAGKTPGAADVSVLSGFRKTAPATETNPVNEDRVRQKTRRQAMRSLSGGFGTRSSL